MLVYHTPNGTGFGLHPFCWVDLFASCSLLYSWLVLVAYEKSTLSFLLAVEIWFGLFCLQLKIGSVYSTYSSPRPGLVFYLRFPHHKYRKLTVSRMTSIASAKTHPSSFKDLRWTEARCYKKCVVCLMRATSLMVKLDALVRACLRGRN